MQTKAKLRLLLTLIFWLVPIFSTFPFIFHINKSLPYFYPLFDLAHTDSLRDVYALWLFKKMWQTGSFWRGFTDAVFYPIGIDISIYMVQISFLGLIAYFLSNVFDWITIYNLLLLIAFFLIGYLSFLLIQKVTNDLGASIIGGLAMQISPWTYANAMSHIFVLWAFSGFILFCIFIVSAIHNIKTKKKIGLATYSLGLFGFTLTLTTYIYFSLFIIIFILIVLTFYLIEERKLAKELFFCLTKLGLVWCIIFSPLIYFFINVLKTSKKVILVVPLSLANQWSVDLLSYFLPSEFNPLFKPFILPLKAHFSGNAAIQAAHISPIILFFSALAIWQDKNRFKGLWLATFLLFFLFSLGPFLKVNGHTYPLPLPYQIIHRLPIFQAIRDCSMMTSISHLSLMVLFGMGIKTCYKMAKAKKYLGLLLIIFILTYINYDFRYAPPSIPKGYELIKNAQDKKTLLELPYDNYCYSYLYFQIFHKKRLINGIGIRYSPFYDTYFYQVRKNLYSVPQETINALNLGYIIIHKDYYLSKDILEKDKRIVSNLPVNKIWEDKECIIFKVNKSKIRPYYTPYYIDFSKEERIFVLFNNFSYPEVVPHSSFTFRWATTNHSDIWFYVWPGDEKRLNYLEVCLHPFLRYHGDRRMVTICINGKKIDTIFLTTDWLVHRISNIQNFLRPGLNKIGFIYDGAFRPYDYYKSSDKRPLSVAFDYIRIS